MLISLKRNGASANVVLRDFDLHFEGQTFLDKQFAIKIAKSQRICLDSHGLRHRIAPVFFVAYVLRVNAKRVTVKQFLEHPSPFDRPRLPFSKTMGRS